MTNKYKQEKKKEVELENRAVRQCTHPRRTRRQESAKKCAEARAERTDRQQLAHLDKLLGKNKGAIKERARLKARISKVKRTKRKSKKNGG